MSAVAQVLQGFFDDASLFPPASLELPSAMSAHHDHRSAWYGSLVGSFVCPRGRVAELGTVLGTVTAAAAAPAKVPVSLTFPAGPAELAPALAECARLAPVQVVAVEVALPDGMSAWEALRMMDDHVPPDVVGYLEVPRDDRRPGVLDALTLTRYRAKFRTGGIEPEAHPNEWELADAVRAAVQRGLPFKCTAGLHHAVRYTDGPLEQHGFLNILLAVDLARHGADLPTVAAVLASRSATAIGNEVARVAAAGRLEDVRAHAIGIGTCSIADPIADLVALSLLADDRP